MDQARKNEMMAVLLFATGLFLFLSLFTFTEQDLSFYTSTPNAICRNMTGVVGAYLGGAFLFVVGRAAYVFPLLFLLWGISRLLQIETRKIYFKLFGTLVLLAAVSASLSMVSDATRASAFSAGGLVGTVSSGFLLEYLGKGGAALFIMVLIALSLLIATEFMILPIVVSCYHFLKKLPVKIKELVPEREDSLIQRPAKPRASRKEIAKKLEMMKKQVEEVRKTALAPVKQKAAPEPRIVQPARPEKVEVKPQRTKDVADTATGEKLVYNLPGIDILKGQSKVNVRERDDDLKAKAAVLERTLLEFDVEAKVVKINRGPVITLYELEPSVGTKVNKITSLSDNISLAMRSANIRILAPIPGKGTIGIEVPNDKPEKVLLRDILESPEYSEETSPIKIALGKDISGTTIVTDLAKMPHLLIAGATGSGKTVCINCIISSILFNASPDEVKFMMIDPKRVELMMFEGIPHLVSPIVTNPKKAAAALNWVVGEMERRYEIFAEKGVRNIASYKESAGAEDMNLPYIVVIVDELADLMMVGQQDVETAIMRIAQLSRAAGIHMILATQRPSVNVITGVIKANMPARISFKVASKVDSRTVLDANGAEKLLGRGDMLLMEPGESSLIRGQCSLVEDSELRRIVKEIKVQAGPRYIESAVEKQEKKGLGVEQEKDDLYHEAVRIVIETKQASVSMVQRKLRVGYTRAARMIDIMEEEGIVGPYNGSKPREILVEGVEELEGTE
ncbi:MAG: DNA translocase FtsK [Candidatus Omnitrophica bacterium]|nr:DNA translocase FtsK [Candidatus Omnitrophota bacterium]MDD5487915.1 DNA translocase FtsK [Candidatus Omnitrophota bacterium]